MFVGVWGWIGVVDELCDKCPYTGGGGACKMAVQYIGMRETFYGIIIQLQNIMVKGSQVGAFFP